MVGHPVPEYRELGVERVIHTYDLFPYVGGHVVATDESCSIVGLREDAAVVATRGQQRC